jgi:hypothetical protein
VQAAGDQLPKLGAATPVKKQPPFASVTQRHHPKFSGLSVPKRPITGSSLSTYVGRLNLSVVQRAMIVTHQEAAMTDSIEDLTLAGVNRRHRAARD